MNRFPKMLAVVSAAVGVLTLGCTTPIYSGGEALPEFSVAAIMTTINDEDESSSHSQENKKLYLSDISPLIDTTAPKVTNKIDQTNVDASSDSTADIKVQFTESKVLISVLNSISYNDTNLSSVQLLIIILENYGINALIAAANQQDAASMWLLARAYQVGMSVPANYGEALRLLRLSCSKRFASGCFSYGFPYFAGRYGVAKDYRRAAEIFNLACSYGSAYACGDLGQLYYNGWGVQQNERTGFGYASKACHMGKGRAVRRACYFEAVMFEEGYGVQRDYAQAASHMKIACDLDHGNACAKLAAYYYTGLGVGRSVGLAKFYANKSCSLDDEMGCEWYRILQSRS